MQYQSIYLTLFLFCGLTWLHAQTPGDFTIEVDGQQLSIAEALSATKTPGFSYYLNQGDETSGFQVGQYATEKVTPIQESTRFQAGSPSAALLCFATLRLVQEGTFALEDKVNDHLKRWTIPGKNADGITVRDLLLEKIRFGTAYKPDGYLTGSPLPSLVELVRGEGQAPNKALKAKGIRQSDGNMEYGGWLVLQLLLEDHFGEDLPSIMQKQVLRPLGMTNSYYASELTTERLETVAPGHRPNGHPLPAAGYYRYAELGTAGLWTTPRDFSRFMRHLLDAAKGKDNRFLNQELATAGLTAQYGQRSLIFHVNEYGNPFWGGANKGYYFYTQANLELDYAVVAAANREVVWQVCNQACWQTYELVKASLSTEEAPKTAPPPFTGSNQGRLGVFYQAQDESQFAELEGELARLCESLDIQLEFMSAEGGVPADITATPAYVLQTDRGRSIHSGRHLDIAAIGVFLRTNLLAPRRVTVDPKTNILSGREGRQNIVIPLKITTPGGQADEDELTNLAATVQRCFYEVSNYRFATTERVQLLPTDRRFYVDLHPYRSDDGGHFLSYALFSQFNCHLPLADNFGAAIRTSNWEEAACTVTEELWSLLNDRYFSVSAGELPRALPETVSTRTWEELGWELQEKSASMYRYVDAAEPLFFASDLESILAPGPGLPRVQFNFPAPLDRYAGQVDRVSGRVSIAPDGKTISGEILVDVTSLTMGNSGLDEYVLGEALKTRRHPTATLRFDRVEMNTPLANGQVRKMTIPAKFTLRGKTVPVAVVTELVAEKDAAGQAQLRVSSRFSIDIKKTFGLKGPDGPDDLKNRVDVSANFIAV